MVTAGVAAGHPATVEAGLAILRSGGSAADAAVAASFAACVAETVMTGLGGGGFATHVDAATGTVTCLDFFVAVPGLDPPATLAPLEPVEVAFGGVPLEFSMGAASVAVPGVPAGCAELHRRFGRLPWAEVLAPAIDLAAAGVPLPAAHAEALGSIAPALLPGDGAAAYAPGGELLRTGQPLFHPGLADTLRRLAAEGTATLYRGELGHEVAAAVREGEGALSAADLAAYRVREVEASTARFAGYEVHGRRDLSNTVATLARLDSCLDLEPGKRAVATAEALNTVPDGQLGDTTNLSVMAANGDACVVTTTLGLGSGVWPAGTGLHLNSMLGEGELRRDGSRPGDRMASMMSPLVAIEPRSGRVALAAGSAGASRIRSALAHVLTGVLADGLSVAKAVARPRFHPVGSVLHAEPGLDERAEAALRRAGYEVVLWNRDRHYFGGASAIGDGGAAGDPRRGGAAGVLSGWG